VQHHPHVVEIFLPLKTKEGRPQPRELFVQVRDELVGRFGGLTAFTRAPAEGSGSPSRASARKTRWSSSRCSPTGSTATAGTITG
jgi:hypothetical protein